MISIRPCSVIKLNSSRFLEKFSKQFSTGTSNKFPMSTNCIFCKIMEKNVSADIKFENEEIMVFKDIKPVATHHYLSVPKEHIENVNSLNSLDHKGLLDRLIAEGTKVIQDQGGDLNDMKLGFHLPPFNTVSHLHMHVISPASSMSFLHRTMFKPNTWWFATAEQIQEKLQKLVQDENSQLNNKL